PAVKELLKFAALPALRSIATPLLLIDLGIVSRRLGQLRQLFPRARLMYSVGTHPLRPLVAELAAEGVGFNVMARTEIDLVLNQGAIPERITLHHPVKSREDVAYAYSRGIRHFV